MSFLGVLLPFLFIALSICAALLESKRSAQRKNARKCLGITQDDRRKLKFVGFFHPYWYVAFLFVCTDYETF